MSFDPFEYADRMKVRWFTRDLPDPLLGLYVVAKDIRPTIILSPALKDNARLRRCVMSEELGHHETSSFDSLQSYLTYQDLLRVSREEHRARRWAVMHLIPDDALWELAVSNSVITVEEASEMFDVIPAYMNLRLQIFLSDHSSIFTLGEGRIWVYQKEA
ncbi:MAG: ImmA/IrrE family metallo-endopeptidase [Firmicutes bacterium]|nr:ImmA/IrrE family metallo-endopeptidase [Bacillota bacterium]